jgi:hypothetical protein
MRRPPLLTMLMLLYACALQKGNLHKLPWLTYEDRMAEIHAGVVDRQRGCAWSWFRGRGGQLRGTSSATHADRTWTLAAALHRRRSYFVHCAVENDGG